MPQNNVPSESSFATKSALFCPKNVCPFQILDLTLTYNRISNLLQTDLENTDYTLEAGATRLFEAEKLARQMAEQEIKAKEDEELNNPMKVGGKWIKSPHKGGRGT